MKITGNQVNSVSQVYLGTVKKTKAAASADAAQPQDRVELSRDAIVIDAARKAIADTPAIREDKVEALRQQIQNGTYQVPSEQIADKILAETRLAKLNK